jgi:hypothetical protein
MKHFHPTDIYIIILRPNLLAEVLLPSQAPETSKVEAKIRSAEILGLVRLFGTKWQTN